MPVRKKTCGALRVCPFTSFINISAISFLHSDLGPIKFVLLNEILTVQIELPSLIIKAVRYLVTNDPTNGTIIHVTRSVTREEYTLENPSWKLDGILQGTVKCVDDSRLTVTDPVGLVNLKEN